MTAVRTLSPRTIAALRLTLALTACAFAATATAAAPLRLSDGSNVDLAALRPGEQAVFNPTSAEIPFAGQTFRLENFVGVVGYSSDIAYVMTVSGSASLGKLTAKPGSILLVPPYGAAPIVKQYDAGRFRASLPLAARTWAAPAYDGLTSIAASQKNRLFFGVLRRTNFNVTDSGAPADERGRRLALGNRAVQPIRFGADGDADKVEYEVLTAFASALATGDSQTVGNLLDPLPFGGTTLTDDANKARNLFATTLVERTDWAKRLDSVRAVRMSKPYQWMLQGAGGFTAIKLRPTTDFIFVESVTVGDSK